MNIGLPACCRRRVGAQERAREHTRRQLQAQRQRPLAWQSQSWHQAQHRCALDSGQPASSVFALFLVLRDAKILSASLVCYAEEGTESEQRKAAAAALDTAASPKPKAVKKQHSGRRRQPPRDAVDAEGSSGGGSEAGQASGNSDAKRQGSGAGVGSSERRQQVGRGGGAPVAGGDPLEAWFKQHYALLKAADLLGAGFLPASAETGWPWGNGRRRRGGQQPRRAKPEAAAAAQRSREQRREERQVARQQAQSSEVRSHPWQESVPALFSQACWLASPIPNSAPGVWCRRRARRMRARRRPPQAAQAPRRAGEAPRAGVS